MRRWFQTRSFWAALTMVLAVFAVPMAASAFDAVDVENAIDATHVFDPYTFEAARTLIDACSDVNNILGCVEANSENLPPELETMIDIYIDLQTKDYDQLLADGGETVFCAAMKIIFEVDVCGLIADAEALPKAISGALGSASNDFVCGLNLGGIQCTNGSPDWGIQPYGFDCAYGPGQWIPPIDKANKDLQGQVNASLVIPPDQPQPSYCQSQICQPGVKICGAVNSNGQCYCSNCPAGQALQGGVCGTCASKSGSDLAQSSDKRSWTRTDWSDTYAPSFDGSHCIETGGSSHVTNMTPCPLGQMSPEMGKCVAACPIGQVVNQNNGVCESCPTGSIASYLHDGSSIGTCSACPYGMQSKLGGSVCACPTGMVQANANAMCQMCPANTYQNFATCSACPTDEASVPGSTYCRKLECPTGSIVINHTCTLPGIHIAPANEGGGPAVIDKSCVAGTHPDGGSCVPNGFSAPATPPSETQGPCPPLSRWTGQVCIGPRGKHFCPEGLTMQGDVCTHGGSGIRAPDSAPPSSPHFICPVFSRPLDNVCIGPRGKHFCPEGWTMRDGICVR